MLCFRQQVAFKSDDDQLKTNVITTFVTDREVQELEQLESSRKTLAHRMARLEKRMKGVMYRESSAVERENRLSRLEADLNATKEALAFNATRQDATQDRLHGSLLELLESVESLDDRVDACLPEMRKEMSKIEFAVTRMNASMAIIKEDQVCVVHKFYNSDYIFLIPVHISSNLYRQSAGLLLPIRPPPYHNYDC